MVQHPPTSRPPGFTRVEVVVVIVLLVFTLGLLPSCAQRVHNGSAVTYCWNNLKQIGLGLHNFEDTFKRLPPLFAGGTDVQGKPVATLSVRFPNANGAPHVLLLPYVEQDNLYKLMMVPDIKPSVVVPSWPPSPNQVNQKVVSTYRCRVAPGTIDGIQEGSGLGGSSYSVNGQVFGSTDSSNGQPSDQDPWDRGLTIAGIKDGSSNTIGTAHSYARCGGMAGDATTPASGAVWGYYNNGLPPSGTQGPPIFMNAVVSGSANVGNGIKLAFQVTPKPHNANVNTGPAGCDPALPATPHRMMTVLLMDASIRNMEPNFPPLVWWHACSPDDGAAMPADW